MRLHEKNIKEESNVGINVGINETQRKIIDFIIKNPETTAEQLADLVGITKRRVESNLRRLKIAGLINRVGARKNGKWIVTHI
ncbi:MAG: winged helix-turn-helix transcriptional regulator [Tannerellaceae bacterium]|nr:winged helix-turn-helix transcriptional regulator [Tannerellaceae bacterium]